MLSDIKINLALGIDPQRKKLEEQLRSENNTFAKIADEFIAMRSHLSENTISHNKRYVEYLNNTIGNMPIADIKPIDVLDACRVVEKKGYLETAKKMRTFAGQVFRYGVQTAKCNRDVTQDLKGALKTPQSKHYAAITDPKELAILLNAIDNYDGMFETRIAIKLMPYVFVRSGELRHALWDDIDFDDRTWTYTPRKTKRKMGVSLIVPLSNQVYDLFREIEQHKRSDLVFPSLHNTKRLMSDGTMSNALKRMGYSCDVHTIHGFRATARTLLVEQLGFDEQLVEMQLGHSVRDMHGRAYNRTTFLDKRRDMMQVWADYLDELKTL